jgi:predicted ATPase
MGFKDLHIQNYQELISLFVNDNKPGLLVNIADIGFGFSQIFPIVVQGLFMPKGHVLLLEQPEIHLHPALQMKLGDFLIALVLSGKQIIVETHSEHIINRLIRRIVEDETQILESRIGISFFTKTSTGVGVEEVIVNDIFGVQNWPDGFFDQAVDEKEKYNAPHCQDTENGFLS